MITALSMTGPLRIFIAMNNLCLPSILEGHGMQVVGCSVEREQILSLAQNARPDVVLFDGALAWPGCTGVEMVDQLRRAGIRAIFVIGTTPNEEHFFQFLKAGAAAYELDTIESSDLTRKIERVAAGEYLLDGEVLRQPPKRHQEPTPSTEPVEARAAQEPEISTLLPVEQLYEILGITAREIEVLSYIMQGYSNKEIGRFLYVSDQTVKNHMTRVNSRLHTHDRTEAVVVALYLGLISLDEALSETGELQPADSVQPGHKTPTEREIEILCCAMRGSTNKEIGRLLKISDQTVKNHIACVIDKLAARSRTGAVAVALRRGLLHFSDADPVRLEAVKTVLQFQLGEKSSAGVPPPKALLTMGKGAA